MIEINGLKEIIIIDSRDIEFLYVYLGDDNRKDKYYVSLRKSGNIEIPKEEYERLKAILLCKEVYYE